jgi:hypothetical protein
MATKFLVNLPVKNLNKIILLFIFSLSFFCTTCKKDPDPNTNNGSTVIFSSNFDTHADLVVWSQSAGGEAVIEQNLLKMVAKTSCFQFETIDSIPVQSGKTYVLKLWAKADSSASGDPHYCGGDFLVYVEQGSTDVITGNLGNYLLWTQKSYSFQAATSGSVIIKFLVGTTKGAWLNDLEFIEQ